MLRARARRLSWPWCSVSVLVGQRRSVDNIALAVSQNASTRHGPTSRVDAAAQACLLDAIKERPDLTLAELQEILAVRQGVRLCIGQLWNVLKKMGIRLKKSRSTPPSATQKAIVKSENNSSNVSGQRRRTT